MKKSSLMSASVVAAALLAIAPIAAPAVSLTSTTPIAQAADAKKDDVTTALQKIHNSFLEKTPDLVVTDPGLWAADASLVSMAQPVTSPTDIFDKTVSGSFANSLDGVKSAAINNPALSTIFQKDSDLNDLSLNLDEQKALTDAKVKFTSTISFTDAKGNTTLLNSTNRSTDAKAGDFEKLVQSAKDNGGTLSLEYKFSNDTGNLDTVIVNLQYRAPAVTSKSATAKVDPETSTAKVGDAIADSLPTEDFDDIHFLDESGKDITDQLKGYIDLSRDIKDSKGNVVTGDKFTQPGDYTRAVTIDFKTLMGTKQFDDKGNPIKVTDNPNPQVYNYTEALKNGKIKVILNGKDIILKDGVDGFDAANGKYTYNRKITVTGEPVKDADKKDKDVVTDKESISGVVTVKKTVASSVAQLFDSKGRVIIDRALPTNSSWKTDYRVKMNGVTYYRVSTDEFVRADHVDFLDNAAANISVGNISGNIAKSYIDNIFKVTGVGLTALWRISDDGQSMIVKEDRWLPQDSRWITDQKAVLNGVTFYRLSTNEWVKANNGYLEK
ncbi:hypothetical protein DS831_01340 [Bombilactobacillus bombi]|uniref:S-layer protein C-terminal domain-containing protein n=1 Tax=Bombilactobacillus bombi TaxID=1303590 RepID=A0A417ZJ37_9LACO|nr:SLAP domain-containing protein [Bombilactobacillus bombi]RHW52002.1 hypothetical protein DS831_01340 [Bombilactobacillus bombi]